MCKNEQTMPDIRLENFKDIEKKVAFSIKGKHGMINVILPEKESTYEDWIELHRFLATIIVRNAMKKGRL